MNNYFKDLISHIDRNLSKNADRSLVYEKLRQIGLTAFGEFMFSLPDENYPSLSKHLPSMAEKEVQINWTGNHSRELLRDSLDFVRLCSSSYSQISGFSLFDKKILDADTED